MKSSNPFPVEPTGFLIGSYLALILYGLHLTQLHSYFTRYSYDPLRRRLLVLWVFLLSTFQVTIIISAGWKYFIGGTRDGGKIWGEFWDPLSVQDGLIPLMAMTAQFYFGHRAWLLWNKNRWIKWFFIVVPTITMMCGVALAITARIWSNDPFVPGDQLHDRPISIPSQVVAILWMGMSAFTDGVLTLLLVTRFVKSKSPTTSSPSTISRLIALTLETVLLTHIVGASMCIIFLASPPARRTQHPSFWILLEIITELYALSILFTINARRPASDDLYEVNSGGRGNLVGVTIGMTALDRQVEGYQGSTPFGVRIGVPSLDYQDNSVVRTGESEGNGGGSSELATPYNQQDGKAWGDVELARLDSGKEIKGQSPD